MSSAPTRAHGPVRVAVLSAHEGSDSWRALLQSLQRTGQVRIRMVSGYSDAEYRHSKSRLQRLRLRLKTFVVYPLTIVARQGALRRDCDTLLVITSPFFLPALVTMLVRGPNIVVLQNDIYPEALIVRKMIRRGGLIDRVLSHFVVAALECATTVVYITDMHREHVARVMKARAVDVVIPVPSHLEADPSGPRFHAAGRLTALYSGTLGMMHDTRTILQFLADGLMPPNLRFVFRTSGAGKAMFERAVSTRFPDLVASGSISIGDGLPEGDWSEMMRSAEIGMVFQAIGAGDVVFPSKAASILVAGQAVLAIAEEQSPLGRLVTEHDCGWVVPPGAVDRLQLALQEATELAVLKRKRLNAHRLGMERFAVDVVAEQWLAVLTGSDRVRESDR